jgi:zinc D-Ala-D-Ala carboxypeptidase
MDWSRWQNFSKDEFDCKHTGNNKMHGGFMDRLQALRTEYGKPMRVTSGYRDAAHPIEAKKSTPGAHASGRAVDIGVDGADALRLVSLAIKHGFTGIGVQQKGTSRFIHLDDLPNSPGRPRPHIWSY